MIDLKELQRLERENPWRGEWIARTFEIDCPCPNGVHCGDQHTCEEVESPESYPGGQCVVQISVPGLETFAGPVARYIAALHNVAPELLGRMAKLEAALSSLRELEENDYVQCDGPGHTEQPCEVCICCRARAALDALTQQTSGGGRTPRGTTTPADPTTPAGGPEEAGPARDAERMAKLEAVANVLRDWTGGYTTAELDDVRARPVANSPLSRTVHALAALDALTTTEPHQDPWHPSNHCRDTKHACCVHRTGSCACECVKCVTSRANALTTAEPR